MKKLLLILFICVIVLPLTVSMGYLNIQKNLLRKSVKANIVAGLEEEELTLMIFSEDEHSNLKWEHKNEFEFNGEMYDVVKRTYQDGKFYYWCWWDNEETQLNKKLSGLVAKIWGSKQSQQSQIFIWHHITTLFHNTPASVSFTLPTDNQKVCFHYQRKPLGREFETSTPPPEFG